MQTFSHIHIRRCGRLFYCTHSHTYTYIHTHARTHTYTHMHAHSIFEARRPLEFRVATTPGPRDPLRTPPTWLLLPSAFCACVHVSVFVCVEGAVRAEDAAGFRAQGWECGRESGRRLRSVCRWLNSSMLCGTVNISQRSALCIWLLGRISKLIMNRDKSAYGYGRGIIATAYRNCISHTDQKDYFSERLLLQNTPRGGLVLS